MKFSILLLCLLVFRVWGVSKLHLRQTGNSTSFLRAFSIIEENEVSKAQATTGSQPTKRKPLLLEYTMELKKDIVLFDELEEIGITILSCSRNADSAQASISMTGANLDSSDFRLGAAFIMNAEDWEKYCGPVVPVKGIDDDDDALFYEIIDVNENEERVSVNMTIVPGEDVIPGVNFTFMEKPDTLTSLPSKVVYSDNAEFAAVSSISKTSLSALMLQRRYSPNTVMEPNADPFTGADNKFRGTKNPFTGAVLDYYIWLEATAGGLKLRRGPLRVEWEHVFDASIGFTLSLMKEAKLSGRGELLRCKIDMFGLCRKILGFQLCVGAFRNLEWVFDGEVDVKELNICGVVEQKSKHHMSLSTSRGLKAINLLPPGASGHGSFEFNFPSSTNAIMGLDLFVGIRPSVGIAGMIGRIGHEGNIGAKLGVQTSAQLKRNPPYSPYTGEGHKIGICERFHLLQGEANICGKELSLEHLKNGDVMKDAVLIDRLFDIGSSTICAIPESG